MIMTLARKSLKKALTKRDAYLRRVYGITEDDFKELLKKQNFVCAVCHRPPKEGKNLCVDHIHIPRVGGGEIRGLCCSYCNRYIIGRHKDPELFRSAAIYLSQGTGFFTPKKIKKKRKTKKKRAKRT